MDSHTYTQKYLAAGVNQPLPTETLNPGKFCAFMLNGDEIILFSILQYDILPLTLIGVEIYKHFRPLCFPSTMF